MINKLFITCLLVLAFAQISNAQIDSTKAANEIIKIEQALADALPVDSALWSKYLDPQWYIVDNDGNLSNKKDFLKTFGPFPKTVTVSAQVTKPVFSFHGNVAVIHYVADEHEIAYGQNLHTTYGTMDVWYKTDNSWMMLSMQDFEIPAIPPSIKINPQVLKQYTGTYKLTDDNIAVVTLKGDSLYIQKNKRKTEALLPETANVFFKKSDARGRKFFVKDESGTMLMRERRNGQDIVWKRISN